MRVSGPAITPGLQMDGLVRAGITPSLALPAPCPPGWGAGGIGAGMGATYEAQRCQSPFGALLWPPWQGSPQCPGLQTRAGQATRGPPSQPPSPWGAINRGETRVHSWASLSPASSGSISNCSIPAREACPSSDPPAPVQQARGITLASPMLARTPEHRSVWAHLHPTRVKMERHTPNCMATCAFTRIHIAGSTHLWVHACACTWQHTHMPVGGHPQTCTHRHGCAHACPNAHLWVHAYVYTWKHMHMLAYEHFQTLTHIQGCAHACPSAHLWVHTHMQVHGNTHACRSAPTNIHACTHPGRHMPAQAHTCRSTRMHVHSNTHTPRHEHP